VAADYLKVIAKPMDLGTVEQMLNATKHHLTVS
jgi:hypothetical protein